MPHSYTPEQLEWLREYSGDFTDRELLEIFNRRFGLALAGTGLRQKCRMMGFKRKYTGRNYMEDHPGEWIGTREFQFKFGEPSPRRRLAGSLKVCTQTGQILVREAEPRRVTLDERGRKVQTHYWTARKILVWERAHGPVPPKHCIIRLVDDVQDDRLAVLMCISRGTLMRLTWAGGLCGLPNDFDLRRAFVLAIDLEQKAHVLTQRKWEEKTHGRP